MNQSRRLEVLLGRDRDFRSDGPNLYQHLKHESKINFNTQIQVS